MIDAAQTHAAINKVWRTESARLVAGLTRVVRDVGLAEELAQDALVAALEQWPRDGIPKNPGAWLMQAAKRRGIDTLRRQSMLERKHAELGREADPIVEPDLDGLDEANDDFGDDVLKLVFVSCHPVLSTEARVALTLRLLGGLTTEEIARAFLATEPTVAQRIVRAKKTLAEKRVPFEVPRGDALSARLASVLEVVYLIFNEGYAATAGDHWTRPALCDEAIRLGRLLQGLAPNEPEVHGLVALMEIQASRLRARVNAAGEPILLLDQDRTQWDQALIQHGLAALARAEALTPNLGRYGLQGAIAACHARAEVASDTDWARIAALYAQLSELTRSPIVELNRAVAVGMAEGPAAGLVVADALVSHPALARYHLLPAVRADLLAKLGKNDDARAELARAADLATNARERELLIARAAALPA